MSVLTDATDAALAAERAYTADLEERAASLADQHVADGARISELVAALAALQDEYDAYVAAHPDGDPAGPVTALGTSMSQWPHGVAPKEVGRCYTDADIAEAIAEKRRVILISTGPISTTQAVAKCRDILARMTAAGIVNPEVHFTETNEADRHITGASAIAAYLTRLRAHAKALAAVPGASVWLNITRDVVNTGQADPWRLTPADNIGYAINTYSPGRKKSPAEYTPYADFVDEVLDFVASTGVTLFAVWEFGTEVNGVVPRGAPAGTPDNRPDYIAGQVRYTVTEAAKRGIRVVVMAYWDAIKLRNGQPDLTQPDNRLMHDEPATSQALANALA